MGKVHAKRHSTLLDLTKRPDATEDAVQANVVPAKYGK
jgi:hypothetical protein